MLYIYTMIAMIGIYSILTLSTNLLIGYGGIVSMSQASIFGIGCYTVAILTMAGWNWWLSLIPAIILTVLINVLLTLPSLRASGFAYMVVTFGFAKFMTTGYSSWSITGANYGLFGIPRASIFGLSINNGLRQMIFVLCFLIVCFYIANRLIKSPYGQLVEAMRQEPTAVDALGKSTLKIKVINSAVSGVFAAIAGGLYAQYITYIEASNFNQDVSFNLTVYVFLGGAATMMGSIAGPIFMLLIPQLISLLPLPTSMVGPFQQLLYGLLLVGFMMFKPSGLVSKKSPEEAGNGFFAKLFKKKAEGSVTDGNS